MALCAFCEDTIVGKAIRRGGYRFCSTECADEFFLSYSDDTDGDGEEAVRVDDDLGNLDDDYDDDDDDSEFEEEEEEEEDLGRYAVDYGDEDEDY